MATVFLGIGSNQGDRLAHLSEALRILADSSTIHLIQLAPVYETKAVGGPVQDDFVNTVVEAETSLSPHELLRVLKDIEHRMGRLQEAPRWGPRPIDLDILLYNNLVLHEPQLTIPHAEMHHRRFVLEPLAQLAPALVHPVLRRSIAELFESLPAENENP